MQGLRVKALPPRAGWEEKHKRKKLIACLKIKKQQKGNTVRFHLTFWLMKLILLAKLFFPFLHFVSNSLQPPELLFNHRYSRFTFHSWEQKRDFEGILLKFDAEFHQEFKKLFVYFPAPDSCRVLKTKYGWALSCKKNRFPYLFRLTLVFTLPSCNSSICSTLLSGFHEH